MPLKGADSKLIMFSSLLLSPPALLLRLLSSSPNLLPPSCTLYLCVATTLLTLASFLHHALITITTSQPPCPTLSLPLYVLDSKQDLPNVSSASVADPEPTPLLDAALTSFIALWSSLTLVFSLVLVFVTRSGECIRPFFHYVLLSRPEPAFER